MTSLHHANCLACGGVLNPLFVGPAGPVGRCVDGCGLTLVTRQPSDAELAASYERLYYGNTSHEQYRPVKENSDAFKLRQHFEALDAEAGLRGKRILDYGCGTGNFMAVAREAGAAFVAGIELNRNARDDAKLKGFHVAESTEGFAGEQFDLIYLNDVIEHLRDPVATCRKLRDLLSPGGAIFLATINIDGLKARLLRSRWDMVQDPTHLYFFNAASLSALLRRAGFENPREIRFQVAFSHHAWLRRRVQRFLVTVGLGSSLKMIAYKPQMNVRIGGERC